jgi:YD repeat-containing protein
MAMPTAQWPSRARRVHGHLAQRRSRLDRDRLSYRSVPLRLLTVLFVLVWPIFGLPGPASSQQVAIHYVYDDLNRLIAVVDQQGNVATYAYDAVGNILRIDRFDTAGIPGPVGITLVSPNTGKVGTAVQIFGKGFSATPSQNSLTFNGTLATVTEAAPNRLVTSVPTGATTGLIMVTTPLGSATSPTPFTVVGSIAIDPTTVTVFASRTQQFTATEADGGTAPPIRWSVNGIPGGDPAVGTITPEGLYTAPAPAQVPAAGLTVTVTATHTDDPTVAASATVTVRPPQPVFLAARGVTVGVAEARTVNQSVTGVASVGIAETSTQLAAAGAVSLQVAERLATFTAAAPAAVAIAPVVTAVTPSSGAPGATLTLTLSGLGFIGATAVTLLQNDETDTTITVADFAVSPDGTQATVEITIAADAGLGDRIVQITTPGGTSTALGTGGNLFTVR